MLSKACNIGTVNIQLRQIQERVELREYSEERRLSLVIIFGLKGKLDITSNKRRKVFEWKLHEIG